MKRAFFLALFFFHAIPAYSATETVSIFDSEGLLRLQKVATTTFDVEIALACSDTNERQVLLTNIDGLLPDIESAAGERCIYRARGISEGSWKIKVSDNVSIASVRSVESVSQKPVSITPELTPTP